MLDCISLSLLTRHGAKLLNFATLVLLQWHHPLKQKVFTVMGSLYYRERRSGKYVEHSLLRVYLSKSNGNLALLAHKLRFFFNCVCLQNRLIFFNLVVLMLLFYRPFVIEFF